MNALLAKLFASPNYRWTALGILFLVYAINFLDRQIFAILQQSIKTDLNLTDTQLGFLGGMAFALLYATLGIPIARLADTYSRARIITVSLGVWSLMTALCGLAQGFISMALARIGVGIGEAGCSPPAHSLIADMFGRGQRATAISIYQSGAQLGIGLGFIIGGLTNVFLGWREAFILCGIPGIFMAILVHVLLKEPARGASEARPIAAAPQAAMPLKSVAGFLWRNKTFRYLGIALSLNAFVGYGVAQWMPSHFIRTFGVDTANLGWRLALINGVVAGLAIVTGGVLADRLGKRDERWNMWIPLYALILSKLFFTFTLFQTNYTLAILSYVFPTFLSALYLSPSFTMIQTLAPLRMRAFAAAVAFFLTSFIGLGLGPLMVGIISDILIAEGIENSLKWALLMGNVFAALAALFFYLASRHVRADVEAANRYNAAA